MMVLGNVGLLGPILVVPLYMGQILTRNHIIAYKAIAVTPERKHA